VREDFPRQTITEIAKGVGYRCSNPDCGRPTVSANAAQDRTITIGVAAHIRAASPGGPRFDPAQSREARRGIDNGIWLCQNCGRLVDADPERFTIEVLVRWKREAQERAFRDLVVRGWTVKVEGRYTKFANKNVTTSFGSSSSTVITGATTTSTSATNVNDRFSASIASILIGVSYYFGSY
jgi:hypothetical protein